MKAYKFEVKILGEDEKDAWKNLTKTSFKKAKEELFVEITDLDKVEKEFYSDNVCICRDCGSMDWKEVSDKAIIIGVNDKGYTQKEDEEWQGGDTYYYCMDCREYNLESIELNEFGKTDEEICNKIKELNNMSNEERKDWLTKMEVIQKLK